MKKIKGFTLIELIIVMAILSILMAGIMQMMKPIRSTFIDSTYFEMQRNTQNGMITYLSESLRYADNIGIYTSGSVATAINDFKTNVAPATPALTDKQIHVITIDNKMDYTYNGTTGFRGRIVVNKPTATGYNAMWADNPSTASARVALSEAYYGACSYSISVQPKAGNSPALGTTKPDSIDITVASLLTHNSFGKTKGANKDNTSEIAKKDPTTGKYVNQLVSTDGYVLCNNIKSSKKGSGNYKAPAAAFNTTTNGQRTYIVYTLPDEH